MKSSVEYSTVECSERRFVLRCSLFIGRLFVCSFVLVLCDNIHSILKSHYFDLSTLSCSTTAKRTRTRTPTRKDRRLEEATTIRFDFCRFRLIDFNFDFNSNVSSIYWHCDCAGPTFGCTGGMDA